MIGPAAHLPGKIRLPASSMLWSQFSYIVTVCQGKNRSNLSLPYLYSEKSGPGTPRSKKFFHFVFDNGKKLSYHRTS
jgi:hypothetical protein